MSYFRCGRAGEPKFGAQALLPRHISEMMPAECGASNVSSFQYGKKIDQAFGARRLDAVMDCSTDNLDNLETRRPGLP